MQILITGTPGVGKTTLSKALSKVLQYKHIDISDYIESNGLYSHKDKKFNSFIFDVDEIHKNLMRKLDPRKSYIIDTHAPDILDDPDFIIILRASNSILYQRYVDRGYDQTKITENISAEINGTIEDECDEYFPYTPKMIINLEEKSIDLAVKEIIDKIDKISKN
ncbi:putative adenylate kinase [Astathelohania contejeani]|uniref:Adenylate kinase isoenzyme 6 homolog n=1 Tax=Astathelohania contejeani TaxID=164912 RepID=A0ABQ7I0R4_9MICR|nr:putative adenylate kinase [Thelohania contejeani]